MFTTPCFIKKNTPELREKLEELGYISHIFNNNDANNIYADKLGTYISVDIENHPYYIDCGTNEELFLALAALRDDNDYMQYFISNESKQFYKCTSNKFDFHQEGIANWLSCSSTEYFRKATVKELKEYFKNIKLQ